MSKRKRRIVYWVADCLHDAKAYSIRAASKRDLLQQLAQDHEKTKNADGEMIWRHLRNTQLGYAHPRKIVIEYTDNIDLLNQLLGEGGVE